MPERLLRQLIDWLDAFERNVVASISIAAILLLGLTDYRSGPEVAFSVFYLLPLSLIALQAGLRLGICACLVAAATWAVADIAAGQHYSARWIYVWNTSSRLFVFVIVVTLFHHVRRSLTLQEELASRDSLTGVFNWRAFDRLATRSFIAVDRLQHPFTIAYVDLDNFKSLNDTLGHAGGDDVLETVAHALESHTRESDVVARLGGDEFALLLPQTDSSAAAALMNDLLPRVLQALSKFPMRVTFSAGAATFLVPPRSTDDMVDKADRLMYDAKRAEKGTFRHAVVGKGEPNAVPDHAPRRSLPSRRAQQTTLEGARTRTVSH
jgi:diguanylate cyclase (GGDEF)-like protein